MLKTILAKVGQVDTTYNGCYPTDPQKFYALPKIHKKDILLGSECQEGVSHLWGSQGADQLYQAIHRTFPHHIRNTQEFVDKVKSIRLGENALYLVVLRPSSNQSQWTLHYPSSQKSWNRTLTTPYDIHVNTTHHNTAEVLS